MVLFTYIGTNIIKFSIYINGARFSDAYTESLVQCCGNSNALAMELLQFYTKGLVQSCNNSSALAMELLQFYSNSLICVSGYGVLNVLSHCLSIHSLVNWFKFSLKHATQSVQKLYMRYNIP